MSEEHCIAPLASPALRRLTTPSVVDAEGRPMQRFGLSYRHDGRFWAFSIWAYGWTDAEARLDAIRAALRLDGEIVAEGDL
ncbi:hypothetical protein ACXHXM_02100